MIKVFDEDDAMVSRIELERLLKSDELLREIMKCWSDSLVQVECIRVPYKLHEECKQHVEKS